MSNIVLSKWREVKTKDEILNQDLLKKDKDLLDSFKTSMEFGTAGIRGIMGAGTNKMNVLTVASAAEAYAKFLLLNVKDSTKKGVLIGHDNRHNSALFSETVAKVLLANGIKAYLFENNDLQPTPLVSFVIREMKLAGGAIITASHNPKEYNGFKVYNSLGAQLMPEDTKKIQEIMKGIDPLKVVRETNDLISYVDSKIIEKYIRSVLKIRLFNEKVDIKIAYTAQHGTSAILGPKLLREIGAEILEVKKQQLPDPDFKYTKTPNPEDAKSYKKAFILARSKKADMIVATDPDADRIGIAVKHERRFKFLDGNQTAAVYLHFLLSSLKEQGKLPKDGYIVTTHVSGDLPAKIASKFGVKTIKVHVGFKNIAKVIEETKGTYLFGFEESYGCLIDSGLARDKDSLQAMVAYAEMVSYYKKQGTNVYKVLKEIYHSFGIHRNAQTSKKLDKAMTDRLLSRLLKLQRKTKIGDRKVESVEDYIAEANLVKVNFEDGSWFAARPSGTEPKVKFYYQTVGTKQQELMDVVYFEKQLQEWINDNTEEFENKKFKWTTFFKYMSFLGITVGIFLLVFFTIYSGSQSAIGDGGKSLSVVTIAGHIFNSTNRGIWFALWAWHFVCDFSGAWAMKRSLKMQGQKAKTWDLFVAGVMGSIVSFLTPFAIGGDAVSYWYMRRRGIKRGPLISSYMTDTLLYQAKFTIQTVILMSIGWGVYRDIFATDNPEAHAALIWFIIGTSWMVFSTFMIFMIMLGRRFQEFIVRNSVKYLEWSRFATITDPGALSAGYMYEFKMVRDGMKQIWGKHWWFPLEMLAYRVIPMFFNPSALIFALNGWVNPDVHSGTYWSQIVGGDIVGTANSMSLTPGGSGTGEWLSIAVNQILYGGSKHQIELGIDARQIASGADFMWKVISGWPWLMFSALLTVSMIMVENRRTHVERINKNRALNNKKKRGDTSSRYYVYAILALFWILLAIMHFFVFFK